MNITPDKLLDLQDEKWLRGERARVEELISGCNPGLISDAALLDLICNEIRLRENFEPDFPDLGLTERLYEYSNRFPAISDKLKKQLEFENQLKDDENDININNISFQFSQTGGINDIQNLREIEEFESGGFGTIYLARQILPDRQVAVKINQADSRLDEFSIRTLHNEAQRAARLRHPNIIEIYEVGKVGNQSYFIMPFIKGGNLKSRKGEFHDNFISISRLMATISHAVSYAHSLDVLHCDLKPSNILINEQGEPVLTDFGFAVGLIPEVHSVNQRNNQEPDNSRTAYETISSVFGTGGTPEYMAPEQSIGNFQSLSIETDIYGLGSVLYELLTGNPPGVRREGDKIPPPRSINNKIPRDLEAICLRCLSWNKGERYRQASEMALDFENFSSGYSVSAREFNRISGFIDRAVKWAIRSPVAAILLLIVFLSILSSTAILYSKNQQLRNLLQLAAQTSFNLGHTSEKRGTKPESETAYLQSIKLFDELSNKYPDNISFLIMKAKSQNNFALIMRELNRQQEYRKYLEDAIFSFQLANKRNPDNLDLLMEEANSWSNLGNYYLIHSERENATNCYQKSMILREKLMAQNSNNAEYQFQLAKSYFDLGNLNGRSTDSQKQAIADYQKAIEGFSNSISNGNSSDDLLQKTIEATINLSKLLAESGDVQAAQRLDDEMIAKWSGKVEADPGNLHFTLLYAILLNNRGTHGLDRIEPEKVEVDFQKARSYFIRAMKQQEVGFTVKKNYCMTLSNLALVNLRLMKKPNNSEEIQKYQKSVSEYSIEAIRLANSLIISSPAEVSPKISLAMACEIYAELLEMENQLAESKRILTEGLNTTASLINHDNEALEKHLNFINRLARLELLLNAENVEAARKLAEKGLFIVREQIGVNRDSQMLQMQLMEFSELNASLLLKNYKFEEKGMIIDENVISKLNQAVVFYSDAINAGKKGIAFGNVYSNQLDRYMSIYLFRAIALRNLKRFTDSNTDIYSAKQIMKTDDPRLIYLNLLECQNRIQLGDYENAIDAINSKMKSGNYSLEIYFNLACLYAEAVPKIQKNDKLSQSDKQIQTELFVRKSLSNLKLIQENGFFKDPVNVAQLEKDSSLVNIEKQKGFIEFLADVKQARK